MTLEQIQKEIKKRYKVGQTVYGMYSGDPYIVINNRIREYGYQRDDETIAFAEISVQKKTKDGSIIRITVYKNHTKPKWAKTDRPQNINNFYEEEII